jgi:hypothetical protein
MGRLWNMIENTPGTTVTPNLLGEAIDGGTGV